MLEFALSWDGDPEDLLVTTWGMATPDGIRAYRQAINTHNRLRPGLLILIDHRRLDWSQMSTAEIRKQSELFPQDAERLGPASLAVVMGSTVDFGLMRMLHGQIPGDVQLQAAVFYSIEEARAWLAERRGTDESSSTSYA
jgi:hypothetical protein